MLLDHCVCAWVPRVENRTRILVIRHQKESFKSTNTARLAALALRELRIVDYGAPGRPFDPAELEGEDVWTLFPGTGPPAAGAPRTLVVLDGTWAQARQMAHRIPRLSGLPRLALSPPAMAVTRLRQPPHPEGMSTIEAIATALTRLEGEAVGGPLLALHERYVEAVLRSRGAWAGPREDGDRDG